MTATWRILSLLTAGTFFQTGCSMEEPAFKEMSEPGFFTNGDDKGTVSPEALKRSNADSTVAETGTLSKYSPSGDDGTAASGSEHSGSSALHFVKKSSGTWESVSGGGNGNGKGKGNGHGQGNSTGSGTSTESEVVTADDRRECAKQIDAEMSDVKSVSDTGMYALNDQDILAIKLTGNQNSLELRLDQNATIHVRGVCIFLAGNHSKLNLQISGDIGTLVYKGRGNQSYGDIEVAANTYVNRILGSLSGNGSYLEVHGSGHYPQGDIDLAGHNSSYVCR